MPALTHFIRDEIDRRGAITFARFMELSLYHPELGYYERSSQQLGCHGDFSTSVTAGGLFGELLAFQFTCWIDELDRAQDAARPPDLPLELIEAGVHDGCLAADILQWLRQNRPDLESRIRYRLIEPSAHRRALQADRLKPFLHQTVWADNLESLPATIEGVIFSNELLDAMPVRRLGWDAPAKHWFEWGVRWADGRFDWTRLPLDSEYATGPDGFGLSARDLRQLGQILPDGFTVESPEQAVSWWRTAATRLGRGKLVAFDYGHLWEQFWRPDRASGTLRSYRSHRMSTDVLASPGHQDITAHVNFSAIAEAGNSTGLKTGFLDSQEMFLSRVAKNLQETSRQPPAWTHDRVRQFQTLTHPEHFGRAFKVLVQSRP